MPGAQCARSLACKNKKAHEYRHHGHTGIIRHSPRNGFNGFLRALPGVPGLLATVVGRSLHRSDTSVGVSGPHDFAVRKSALVVCSAACVHRIPPRVRDDRASAPLPGRDVQTGNGDLPDGESEIFFAEGLDSHFGNTEILPDGQISRRTPHAPAGRSGD
jgi:hypothetical protein